MTAMTERSIYWNELHTRALSVLTRDAQHVSALRVELANRYGMDRNTALVALQDLVAWGCATEAREPLTTADGHTMGERIYFAAFGAEA